jgi:predicted ABC-type transport system involved in lysophospholipase L1 biosynthesis ATPase subunit
MVTHNTEHAARFARCLELRDGNLTPVTASTTGGE